MINSIATIAANIEDHFYLNSAQYGRSVARQHVTTSNKKVTTVDYPRAHNTIASQNN